MNPDELTGATTSWVGLSHIRAQRRAQDPELSAGPRGPCESDLWARWFVPIEKVTGENRAWCCAR